MNKVMNETSPFKPIEPAIGLPTLDELRDLELKPPDPPAVEVAADGSVKVVRAPNRPAHLCIRCKHYFEFVRKRDAGPRPTGRINAEWVGMCTATPEPIDMAEETVFVCNTFSRKGLKLPWWVPYAVSFALSSALTLGLLKMGVRL